MPDLRIYSLWRNPKFATGLLILSFLLDDIHQCELVNLFWFLKFSVSCGKVYLFFFHRDIQDLQRRNQELLEVVRELGERKDEEESLATEEK